MSDPNEAPNPGQTEPSTPTEEPNGTPVENPSGNVDAESNSDVASGGAPE